MEVFIRALISLLILGGGFGGGYLAAEFPGVGLFVLVLLLLYAVVYCVVADYRDML